jgi:hypothetical protein
LSSEALQGLAGEFVRSVEGYTEAHPPALLVQFLVAFGNVVGRTAHAVVGADKHYTNLFALLVGTSGRGKGASWSQVRAVMERVDPEWAQGRVQAGLTTGAGLIEAVRDPEVGGDDEDAVDPGVDDKRLLIEDEEFGRVLKLLKHDPALSPYVRQAWDRGDLRTMTKFTPARATGAHVSIVGHTTTADLNKNLADTEVQNGFANRFLYVHAEGAHYVDDPEPLPDNVMRRLADRVRRAVEFAQGVDEMHRDEEATTLWRSEAPRLRAERPGVWGAVTGRARPQVVRLSLIYALLDLSPVVKERHLRAALAVWRYADDSARHIFGSSLGNPVAERILDALRENEAGLSRTNIRDLFKRNKTARDIEDALALLLRYGFARKAVEETNGRSTERWFASQQVD